MLALRSLVLTQFVVLENKATQGGALYLWLSNALTMENSTMSRKQFSFHIIDYLLSSILDQWWKCIENQARYGGAILLERNNVIIVINSILSRKPFALHPLALFDTAILTYGGNM